MAVYSHSRISAFENCPLLYRYRYIDKIKRDVEGIEAFVGKLVHEVLDALYADTDHARSAGAAEYVALFSELWSRKLTPAVRIVREEMTRQDYRALGERCVRTYYDRYHPFETGEVLGRECEVNLSLDAEGRYKILGFIDRVDRTAPGLYEIHDYKTGALPRSGALKRDRQLSLYEIAVRERWEGVREVRQVWHYMAHDKEFVERRRPDDLASTRLKTIRSIQEIESTAEFPSRRSPLCSWCEYKAICPEWESVSQRQTAPRAEKPPAEMDPISGQFLLFGGATDT